MKKRIFILVLLLLALFVIALDYYVQSDAFSARLRPYILSPLQEMLGPGARIGLIKANAVPLYLEVRDVFIPGDVDTDAVRVRKVRVHINPFPLLVNRISLPAISLLEPQIQAARSAAGELSVLRMVERISREAELRQQKTRSRFTVDIGTISVHNGTIDFLDRATEAAAKISNLAMTVRFKTPGNNIRMSVQNASLRIAVKTQPELVCSLRGRAEYDHDELMLSSIELLAPDVKVMVSGAMGMQPEGVLDLAVKGSFGQQLLGRLSAFLNKNVIKKRRPLIDLMVSVKGRMTAPEVDGTVAVYNLPYQSFTIQDAALLFSYRNNTLSLTGKQWRIESAQNKIIVDSVAALLDHRGTGFDITKMEISAGDLVARLTGSIDATKGYEAELSVDSSGKSRTLSFLTGVSLEGKAALVGRLTGDLWSPVFDGAITAGPVTIKDILFHDAAGGVRFRDKRLSFAKVDIHQLGSRYILDGSIDFRREDILYAARLNVVRSDVVSIVSLFYKPLPLQLSATGEITFIGSSNDFSGSASLTLGPGSVYGESFKKGSLKVALTPDQVSFPQLVLQKGSGVVEGDGWIGFNGTYAAQLTSRGVNISDLDHLSGITLSGIFDLEIKSNGTFSNPQVTSALKLEELRYHQVSMGVCTAKLTIDSENLVLKADFINEKARLAGSMNLQSPYTWNAAADVRSLDMAPFIVSGTSEAPSRVKLVADGKVTAHGRGTALPSLAGSAVFQHMDFTLGDYQLVNEGDAVVNMEAGKLLVKTLNFTGPGTSLSITGSSQAMKDYDITITGKANLSFLKQFYREVEHSDGIAAVTLTVKDAWKDPEIAGNLRLENGEIKIKDIPQTFNALNGSVDLNRERIVVNSITGDIGGGKMTLTGWVQLAHFLPQDFSTRVAFDNVTVRYPPGLVSTLSGELYYDGDASEQSLSGDVLIKRALYDKRVEWKSMLLDTFKGFAQKRKTEIGWIGETQLNIRFHGKDSILIQNNLAKIPIEVDAFIRGTPSQPQLLGRLEARSGVAYFRRNDFKIQHASVDFVDPNRINPILDIEAETHIREYTIRLAVSGAADRATVTFVSDPPLSEMDILSMLALGKTSADLKGKGGEVGMSEAASFATGQFQDIFEQRARSLTGLDRFQVDPYLSKDTSVPRVTVGKELIQDKLYFTYSSNVGTTTPDTVLRIEYILDKHFSLVGEQNELGAIGGDVKFRFEFK